MLVFRNPVLGIGNEIQPVGAVRNPDDVEHVDQFHPEIRVGYNLYGRIREGDANQRLGPATHQQQGCEEARQGAGEESFHTEESYSSSSFLVTFSGRICGKKRTSWMVVWPVMNMVRRSIPMPRPEVGGIPYSRARTKS